MFKPIPIPLRALLATALVCLAGFSPLRAQTDVVPIQPTTQLPTGQAAPAQQQTTTVQRDADGNPILTTTTTTTAPVVPVQPVAPEEVLSPGEHVAEIQLTVSRGSVQAYFGRAARREKIGIGDVDISIKLPSTSTVTKLASRDKTSEGATRITADNPWSVRVRFSGPGRYVFNLVEWDNDPVVTSALVRVDGQVMFSGHGSDDNINGWAQKSYGPGVVKSGSREIAFTLE